MEDNLSHSIINEFLNYNTFRHKNCKPPKEAFYFFPKGKDLIEWDPKNQKKTMRRIFEGGTEYNEFEKAILSEFATELENFNKNSIKLFDFPQGWQQADTLRYIQGSEYNFKNVVQNLLTHFTWRKETLPVKITNTIIDILNLGFIYGHGRDTNYRPIFIINARIFKEKLHVYSVEEWINSIVFFIEYMIKNLCIPGQVENWNIIMDVSNFSMLFIPSQLKTIFSILMNNYRCRLNVMYIVNASTVLGFLWNTIKGLLDPNTEKKIKILKNNEINEILQIINPEQIEKKFGGLAPNVESYFFPHIIPSDNFSIDNDPLDKLMPEESYIEYVQKNNKYLMSPYVDFKIIRMNGHNQIKYEAESIYEDAVSRSFTAMLNINRSSRTMKTLYEECEDKFEELKRNFKSNEIFYEIYEEKCEMDSEMQVSNEESQTKKEVKLKKMVTFIRMENDIHKTPCCYSKGSCLII